MKPSTRCASMALALLMLTGSAASRATDLAEGLQMSCDSTLLVSDGNDLTLNCRGNLTLQGVLNDVRLARSGSITLEAGQDLSLAGLSLAAASVNLISVGRLQLASDVRIFSPDGTVVLDASNPDLGTPPVRVVGGSVSLRSPTDTGGLTGALIVEAGGDVGLGGTPGITTAVPEPTAGLMGLLGAALALAMSRGLRRPRQ